LEAENYRVPDLLCSVVRTILRLAILVELRLVMDVQTDGHITTTYTALAWRRAVKIINDANQAPPMHRHHLFPKHYRPKSWTQ